MTNQQNYNWPKYICFGQDTKMEFQQTGAIVFVDSDNGTIAEYIVPPANGGWSAEIHRLSNGVLRGRIFYATPEFGGFKDGEWFSVKEITEDEYRNQRRR